MTNVLHITHGYESVTKSGNFKFAIQPAQFKSPNDTVHTMSHTRPQPLRPPTTARRLSFLEARGGVCRLTIGQLTASIGNINFMMMRRVMVLVVATVTSHGDTSAIEKEHVVTMEIEIDYNC